jgi:hypothetical protein
LEFAKKFDNNPFASIASLADLQVSVAARTERTETSHVNIHRDLPFAPA